jgi:hypothetical protein
MNAGREIDVWAAMAHMLRVRCAVGGLGVQRLVDLLCDALVIDRGACQTKFVRAR